MDESENS
jgi:hypothetical protein